MAWVIGIVVLILLVVSAGFRKFAGILVLIAVIGGVIFWQYQDNEEKKSKTRIKQSQLLFEDVSLKRSYGSYDMVGRITNNSSQYTLKGVQLKLTFRDCDNENKNCVIVAEDDEYIYINIPPKQARDFKESVYLYSDLKIKGKMVWDYKIEYTKAE
jgi:hypothetical protein